MSIQITKHARDRYIQRAVFENDLVDDDGKRINIERYGTLHHDRLEKELNKLFESCDHIYTGQVKEHKAVRFFINKNGWCLLLDRVEDNLVTVYKIDLELGDEAFNTQFIEKSIEHIKKTSIETSNLMSQDTNELSKLKAEKAENDKIIASLNEQINTMKGENKIIEGKIDILNGRSSLYKFKEQDAVTLLVCKDKGR